MTLATPRYLQLEALLDFLYESLRADEYLISYLAREQSSEPEHPDPNLDDIVASTLEHSPFRLDDAGDARVVRLYDTELPVLAIWERESEQVRVGPFDGERVRLGLVYVFRTQVGTNSTVSPEAWAQRISKALWWRLVRALDRHTLTGWGTTGDLLVDGKIHSLAVVGKVQRLGNPEYEGLATELEMVHVHPPYAEMTAGVLDTVAWEGHPDVTHIDDPPVGLVVAGDFDVNESHDPTP
ncbi:MAG: hypothetical protein MUF10_11265 [Thermoanaerobaculaceae bacterium]|jgi:hypothetical protein|nr:hypothetical protein [Thermoanaerobaculaceae bacterium]